MFGSGLVGLDVVMQWWNPTDKDVIAFSGELEFVSPVQIWIIQGGWQFVEKTNSGNNS